MPDDNFWDAIPDFESWEFDDPDYPGSGVNIDRSLVLRLQRIRTDTGWPMIITAGVDVDGVHHSESSYHNLENGAMAADFYFDTNVSTRTQYHAVSRMGVTGLGVYFDWHKGHERISIPIGFHIDERPIWKTQRWVRKSGKYIYLLI